MKKELLDSTNRMHQLKSYLTPSIKGFIYSGIITTVFFLFLWGVQSSFFSLIPVKLKPLNSSYSPEMLYSESGLQAQQTVAFAFTLTENPYDAILFNPVFSSKAFIKMNDELTQPF